MTFNEIPNGLLVPGFWTEFDNSAAAGSGIMPWVVLLIGSMTSEGNATADLPVQIFSDDEADILFGKGSQAALMARAFRKNNQLMPLWVAGVADGTTKATKTLTITGPATAGGTIALYVGGEVVYVPVAAGDAAADIAESIASAVTAQMPVTAAESTNTVVFTAKNGGTAGNSIDIRVNYAAGDVLPAGVCISGTGYMTGGAGDPSVTGVIENIQAQWFNIIVVAFQGGISSIKDELLNRWSATNQKTGVCIFGESFTLRLAIGIVLILSAVILLVLSRGKETAK